MLDDLTRIMQDMDTQASNDLEVVFDSTTTAQGLQVRNETACSAGAALLLWSWDTLTWRMRTRITGGMWR